MTINEEIWGDVAVLTVEGTLRCRPEVTPFHDRVKRLVKVGITNVVVDFSGVKWFGSAMLGILVASLTTLHQVGGDLRLTGIGGKIKKAMRVTHLTRVFRTVETVDRAVASFETRASAPDAILA